VVPRAGIERATWFFFDPFRVEPMRPNPHPGFRGKSAALPGAIHIRPSRDRCVMLILEWLKCPNLSVPSGDRNPQKKTLRKSFTGQKQLIFRSILKDTLVQIENLLWEP
jgi:hypothetical protein